MKQHLKISIIAALLIGLAGVSFADRGAGKKSKLKTTLNINSSNNYSFKASLSTNLRTGLTYKGSLLTPNKSVVGSTVFNNSLMTFQKGNTTYIIPFKQKTFVPEMTQGYTGVKMIIRSKK